MRALKRRRRRGTEEDGNIDNSEDAESDGNHVDGRIAYVLEKEDESDGDSEEGVYLIRLVEQETEEEYLDSCNDQMKEGEKHTCSPA